MAQKKKADKSADEQQEKKSAAKKSESSAKTDKKSSDKKPSEKKSDKSSDKKSANKDKKPSVFSRIAKYFRECKSEIKKIVWPTPKATFRNMGIVLVVLIVVGLFIYGLDTGLIALLKLVMDI